MPYFYSLGVTFTVVTPLVYKWVLLREFLSTGLHSHLRCGWVGDIMYDDDDQEEKEPEAQHCSVCMEWMLPEEDPCYRCGNPR
jgi:hypothetical protein